MEKFSRGELIEAVGRMLSGGQGTEEEESRLMSRIEASVADPNISDYMFWDRSDPPLTAEQIVDKALAYRPIALGGKA